MNATNRIRRGLTLTELLIVISIIVLVTGVMVPLVQPLLKGQDTREAARITNVFFASAQARATQLGRPVGVWLERAAHEPDAPNPGEWYAAYKMYLAEQPEPYAGDTFDARVFFLQDLMSAGGSRPPQYTVVADPGTCDSALNLVQPGDFIQFNFRGERFLITSVSMAGVTNQGKQVAFTFRYLPKHRATLLKYLNQDRAYANLKAAGFNPQVAGQPFQIFRVPQKTSSTPTELPSKVAIDLSLSGIGDSALALRGNPVNPFDFAGTSGFEPITPEHDVVIMFSPNGGLDKIYYVGHEQGIPTHVRLFRGAEEEFAPMSNAPLVASSVRVVGPVSLMVGRAAKVGYSAGDSPTVQTGSNALGEGNLLDLSNLWITISDQSGKVTSAPNLGAPTGVNVAGMAAGDWFNVIGYARSLTKSSEPMGGR